MKNWYFLNIGSQQERIEFQIFATRCKHIQSNYRVCYGVVYILEVYTFLLRMYKYAVQNIRRSKCWQCLKILRMTGIIFISQAEADEEAEEVESFLEKSKFER